MFKLTITTDNAAFQPDPRPEVARILREVAERVEIGDISYHFRTVYDINGNDVGRAKLITSEEN